MARHAGDAAEGIDGVSLAAFAHLERLPVGERIVFVLHNLFGVRFDEIATLAGLSPTAARELAERGRLRLRGGFASAGGSDVTSTSARVSSD